MNSAKISLSGVNFSTLVSSWTKFPEISTRETGPNFARTKRNISFLLDELANIPNLANYNYNASVTQVIMGWIISFFLGHVFRQEEIFCVLSWRNISVIGSRFPDPNILGMITNLGANADVNQFRAKITILDEGFFTRWVLSMALAINPPYYGRYKKLIHQR